MMRRRTRTDGAWRRAAQACGLALLLAACSARDSVEVAGADRSGPAVEVTGVDASGFPDLAIDVRVLGPDGRPATGLTDAAFAIQPEGEGALVGPGRITAVVPFAQVTGGRPTLEVVFVLGGDPGRPLAETDPTPLSDAVARFMSQRLDSRERVGVHLVDSGRWIGPGLEPNEAAAQLGTPGAEMAAERTSVAALSDAATRGAEGPRALVVIPGPDEPAAGSVAVATGGRSVWVLLPQGAAPGPWAKVAEGTGGGFLTVENGESGVLALERVVERARREETTGRYRIAYRSGVLEPAALDQAYVVRAEAAGAGASGAAKVHVDAARIETALDAALPELFREARELARKKGLDQAVATLVAIRRARPDSEPAQAVLASVLAEAAGGWLALGDDARAIALLDGTNGEAARSDQVVAERVAEVFFEAARDRRRGNEPDRALALTEAVRTRLPGIGAETERDLALRARLREVLEGGGVPALAEEIGRQAPSSSLTASAREVVLERCRTFMVEGGVGEIIALERQLGGIDAEWSRTVRPDVAATVQGAVDASITRGDLAQAERWIAEAERSGDPAVWRARRYALAKRTAEVSLGGPERDRARAIESLTRALEGAPPAEVARVSQDLARVAGEEAEERAAHGEIVAARQLLGDVRKRVDASGAAILARASKRIEFQAGRSGRETGQWEAARAAFLASLAGDDALQQTESREAEVGVVETSARMGDWDGLVDFVRQRRLAPGPAYLEGCAASIAAGWRDAGDRAAAGSDWAAATAAYDESVRWQPDPETRRRLMDAQLAGGDPENAAKTLLGSDGTTDPGEGPEKVARSLLDAGRPETVYDVVARSGGRIDVLAAIDLLVAAHLLAATRDSAVLAGAAIDQVPAVLASFGEVEQVDVVDEAGNVTASSSAAVGRPYAGPTPGTPDADLTACRSGSCGIVLVRTGSSRIYVRHRLRPDSKIASAARDAARTGDWPGVVAAVARGMNPNWARSAAILAAEGLARDLAGGGDVSARLASIERVMSARKGSEYAAVASAALSDAFSAGSPAPPPDPRIEAIATTYRSERPAGAGPAVVEYAHPVYVAVEEGKERWGVVRWGVLDGHIIETPARGKP